MASHPERPLNIIDLQTVVDAATALQKTALRDALGAGSGSGSMTNEAILAALKTIFGYTSGDALLHFDADGTGGVLSSAPISNATTYHLLAGVTGLTEYGASLHRWEHRSQAIPVVSGVATFTWPKDIEGQRDQFRNRTISTNANLSLAIEALDATYNPAIAGQNLIDDLVFDIVNSGVSAITVQPAAAAAGRMPIGWANGAANFSIPGGGSARVLAYVARNAALIERKQGTSVIVPVAWVETAAQTTISTSFTIAASLMTVGDFQVAAVVKSADTVVPGEMTADGWTRYGTSLLGGAASAVYGRRVQSGSTNVFTLPTGFSKAMIASYRNVSASAPVRGGLVNYAGGTGDTTPTLKGIDVGTGGFVVHGYHHQADLAMPVRADVTQRAVRNASFNRFYLADTGGVVTTFADEDSPALGASPGNYQSFALILDPAEVSS